MEFQKELVDPKSWRLDFESEDIEIVSKIEHGPMMELWSFEVILKKHTCKKYLFESRCYVNLRIYIMQLYPAV